MERLRKTFLGIGNPLYRQPSISYFNSSFTKVPIHYSNRAPCGNQITLLLDRNPYFTDRQHAPLWSLSLQSRHLHGGCRPTTHHWLRSLRWLPASEWIYLLYVTTFSKTATSIQSDFRRWIVITKRITALVVVVPKDKLTINGPTKSWAGKGSSGKAVHRIFCSECGSPIAHDPDAAPEIIALKGGTLDSELKKTLKPVSLFQSEFTTRFFFSTQKNLKTRLETPFQFLFKKK